MMVDVTKENTRTENIMVKEQKLGLMETSMKGNSRMGKGHGQGTYTWSDGRKYEGEWKDGKRWNGTTYEIDGTIFGKIVNGKKIKQ